MKLVEINLLDKNKAFSINNPSHCILNLKKKEIKFKNVDRIISCLNTMW